MIGRTMLGQWAVFSNFGAKGAVYEWINLEITAS